MLDIFNSNAFSVVALTDAINMVPNTYGAIKRKGLFTERSVTTTTATVEIKNGVLNLLPPKARGEAASQGTSGKRLLKSFPIPHFPHEDRVLAEEIQGVRRFGSENNTASVMEIVNDKLADMRAKHAITEEWLRAGALRGVVMDDVGDTILDLFTEFGVSQKVVDFKLGTDGTDVAGKCREVSRHIEQNLMGDTSNGVGCLCSSTFFDKLVAHPTVATAYQFQQGQNTLRDDMRKGFTFQGITFEEYVGTATDIAGDAHPFIPAGDARFFPLGTQQTFRMYRAPADFIETVNTPGMALYAKQEPMKFGKGIDIHTQMNPLPLCMRPSILVRGHSSD